MKRYKLYVYLLIAYIAGLTAGITLHIIKYLEIYLKLNTLLGGY